MSTLEHQKTFRAPSMPSCARLSQNIASSSTFDAQRLRRHNLSQILGRTLDRVNVLGDDTTYGHTGCVNALSWARDGELLLSGGDDTTVRIWCIDPVNTSTEYPFVCRSVIPTGHRANIFNAHMLPHSSRIATVAGDKQVRVFDVGEVHGLAPDNRSTRYSSHSSCTHILRCHEDRVKRIVTEDSPDLFLSVGEDGAVRQHDLRTPHECYSGTCHAPLAKVNHELSTLTLSPLTPYQFVVAGESPYGYLFDRRQSGRFLQEEWGIVPQTGTNDLTACVRRFGRAVKTPEWARGDHIVHIDTSTAHDQGFGQVLLSYSVDAVYLYSTKDDPEICDSMSSSPSPLLDPNVKRRKLDESEATKPTDSHDMDIGDDSHSSAAATDGMEITTASDESSDDDESSETYTGFDDLTAFDASNYQPHVPVILPRRRFAGARNVATIKDVNFLGPNDEFVTSGSDDGNFFIWRKATGALHGIFEGDSSVVNVIEGHPHLPLIAISGIDNTVKLFAPTNGPSEFSRTAHAERIIETNVRLSRTRTLRYNFAALLAEARIAVGTDDTNIPPCTSQ